MTSTNGIETVVTPETKLRRNLAGLFNPRAIAVVGASQKSNSVGYAILRNLLVGNYSGVLYPVNPKAHSIGGVKCFPSLSAIGDPVDLAVIIVPASAVPKVVAECGQCGIGHAIVISAGFKEVGKAGKAIEDEMVRVGREHNVSILGPNCLGLINTDPEVRSNASFASTMPAPGRIAFLSQSGALCTAILDYANGRGIGFSKFISFGNKADINEIDLLAALGEDPCTDVILMYIEDISSGQEFVTTAFQVTHGPNPKPVLAIKTGRTPQGAAAAASHTGSLAGSDEVYDTILAQGGVVRIETIEDLFNYATVFLDRNMPKGNRVGIVTNAGGPGIMTTDACIRYGLQMAKLQEYTLKSLKNQLPAAANIKNPVDVIGDARHDRYQAALDAVCGDEGVDAVIVLLTPQNMTNIPEIAQVVVETRNFISKPVIACFMGAVDVAPGIEIMERNGVPYYRFPEHAARALAARCRFAKWLSTPAAKVKHFEVDRQTVQRVFDEQRAAGRTHIVELPALEIMRAYGFSVVPFRLARNADEAVVAAKEIGHPVVMKIAAPEVLHKTDVGGVKMNVRNDEEARAAFDQIMVNVKSKLGEKLEIWGVLVQQMLPKGKEVILGVSRDPKFGPLIMFGLGGIYTEALRDVVFRLAPLPDRVAEEMVSSIRSYKLLEGVRGEQPSDIPAVVDCLLRLSQLVTDWPEIKELDINPMLVYPRGKGVMAADARIILSQDNR